MRKIYSSHARRQRRFVERRLHARAASRRHQPRRKLRSRDASQAVNQFHIHIDCVRPDVRDSLQRQQAGIGLPGGSRFQPDSGISATSPCASKAIASMPTPSSCWRRVCRDARARMGKYSLVVVGEKSARRRSGFLDACRATRTLPTAPRAAKSCRITPAPLRGNDDPSAQSIRTPCMSAIGRGA